MKLSLKLQDEHHQNSLLKAKIPISMFNQPFTSYFATTTASPQDFTLSLSTNFPSGPSLKLSYSPSATSTTTTTGGPFSLSIRSGLGLFGSPKHSPLIFSADFSLSPSNPNTVVPTFLLHLKPQFGHFSLHKTTSSNPIPEPKYCPPSIPEVHLHPGSPSNSEFGNGFVPDEPLGWQELKLEPCNGNGSGFTPNPNHINGAHSNNGIGFVQENPLVLKDSTKGGFLGIAVMARTVVPVTKRVALNLRWGLNLRSDLGPKMPFLTVNKIGIERVEELKEVERKSNESDVGKLELLKGMCFWMRRDLEVLEKENREMKQSLEEIKLGVSTRNFRGETDGVVKKVSPSGVNSGEFERWRSKKNGGEGNGQREMKKPVNLMCDVESELQKAIKAASSS